MNASVKETCDLVLENRSILKKKMFWELDSNTYAIMGALLTASRGTKADADYYKKCKKIIRKNVNIFSEIRGIGQAIVATKMCMCDDPEAYIKGVTAVYKKLRHIHKLTASPYMVMAAMNIYEAAGINKADEMIEKLESLYKGLKAKHPLLVGDSDRGYLSMLINAGINEIDAVDEIERSYEACKKISIGKNSVYSLAQVLSLSSKNAEDKNDFVKKMVEGLKKKGKRISKSYGLTTLGALALLDMPAKELIDEIVEVDNYIKGKKGFKWYNQGKGLRVTYASLIVFMSHSKDKGISEAISSNIAMAIAEEIIILIIIMITSSRTSSSSSSSN